MDLKEKNKKVMSRRTYTTNVTWICLYLSGRMRTRNHEKVYIDVNHSTKAFSRFVNQIWWWRRTVEKFETRMFEACEFVEKYEFNNYQCMFPKLHNQNI